MAAELTLYTNPQSRGRIARWMLEEVGAPYATEIVEYGPPMKSPEYLALNPMGKVPTLRHGERIVTEAAAICAYLAETFPDAGLAPAAEERADYYRWLFFAAGPVETAVAATRVLGVDESALDAQQQGMLGHGSYARVMDTLARALRGRDYVAGDRFTAADVYLGAHVAWGLEFGTFERRPEFEDYAGRATARAAYRRASELDDAAVAGD